MACPILFYFILFWCRKNVTKSEVFTFGVVRSLKITFSFPQYSLLCRNCAEIKWWKGKQGMASSFFFQHLCLHDSYSGLNLCYNAVLVTAPEVRQGEETDSYFSRRHPERPWPKFNMFAEVMHTYIFCRWRPLPANLKSEGGFDKAMSSLVCNQTSELKGSDDRLFKYKDS